MQGFFKRIFSRAAIALLPAGLLVLTPLSRPGLASNPFNDCTEELLASGVAGDEAAVACAQALIPDELSECVLDIRSNTPVDADAALRACFRVRRPPDLAECVVDINQETLEPYAIRTVQQEAAGVPEAAEEPESEVVVSDIAQPTALFALDTCRRSLLPERFSECVIAVSRNIPDIVPTEAMQTCIAAEVYPPELFPQVGPDAIDNVEPRPTDVEENIDGEETNGTENNTGGEGTNGTSE